MTPVSAIFIYLLIWWMVLFCVLPWGNRPEAQPGPGHVASAPANPRLGLKFLATTGISAIILLVVFLVLKSDLIDFRSIAAAMMQEDKTQ